MADEIAVGVPERTQVELRLKPAGRLGVIEQEVIAPPEFFGVCVEIAKVFPKLKGAFSYSGDGAGALTVIV